MPHEHEDMVWRSSAVDHMLELRDSMLAMHRTETVGIDRVTGRILADEITAPRDLPGHNHATMDGYAFNATQEHPLSVVGDEVYPEDEPPSMESGEAVEIATGASLPPEANAVLKREDAEVEDGELFGAPIESGTYTYEQGTNTSAGEQLFRAGERLSAKDAILLGDLGFEEITVTEPFSVGVLATGTEIHEGRQQDLDSPMLVNLVRSWGHETTYEGTVPDEHEEVRAAITELADRYDVILTTGGTSVGHKDYVVRTLQELGEVHFHRVRIRPGKPIAAATVDDATAIAIPGKPIGAHTISSLVARPFFTGQTHLPTLTKTVSSDVHLGPEGFEYVIPVVTEGKTATPLGHVDSPLQVYEETFDPSVLSSSTRATRADGFVIAHSELTAGESVAVVPYHVVG